MAQAWHIGRRMEAGAFEQPKWLQKASAASDFQVLPAIAGARVVFSGLRSMQLLTSCAMRSQLASASTQWVSPGHACELREPKSDAPGARCTPDTNSDAMDMCSTRAYDTVA